jgi:sugar/nucleoside kinase (ribokinase family)
VLCVGLTTLDVVHHLDGAPRWGAKHRSVGGELVAGGPAANAAVAAARLLDGVRLLTALGGSPLASPVLADLVAHGVTVLDLAPPDSPVRVASAAVDVRTGDRTVFGSATTAPALGPPVGEVIDAALAGTAAVLLDGHHPRVAAVAARRAAGRPVVLDAGSWKDGVVGLLPDVTVAACSADLRPPGGVRAGDDPHAAAAVLHRLGVPTVLVTDGPRPLTWSTADGGRGTLPVPAVTAVDTLGAGDAFHGALAAALAAGLPPVPDAACLAAEVAAVRCACLGARAWLADLELDPLAARLSS